MKSRRIVASAVLAAFSSSQTLAQSEFHHEEDRAFYVGKNTDAAFSKCVEFIEFLPQHVVNEISFLLRFDIENPITIRKFTPSIERGDPFDALSYWFEPTDRITEEYSVATSCVRFPEEANGPEGGAIIYRVVYRYFASEKGAFETTNAAGYYINSIVTDVTFEEL